MGRGIQLAALAVPERMTWDAKPSILPGEDGFYPVAMPGVTKAF